jgi:putative glycerol-1-phosphate prenyltransferase
MPSLIYNTLFKRGKKILALLIDPESQDDDLLISTLKIASKARVDVIFVGGSLTSRPIDETMLVIRDYSACPVVLFPGNLLQLSGKADGILLLSLLSGRNPEYLIGNHVLASRFLKASGMEIIPTGYILIDGHHLSSVEYISNTRPIPSDKKDIIIATALAGEQLGLKLIYLEAGSGANSRIKEDIVAGVRENLTLPILVGGGIRTPEDIRSLFNAGADGIVIGSAVEEDYRILPSLAAIRNEFR